ncbi:MAG: septation regulator SpoVG [Candidatus Wallbacteria bacterium]|nr:septation regulator SpoVG [Candidatus Wallbacteria bacterium]
MKITEVRVRPVRREGKLKAVVSITIDDVFVIHNLKIIDGKKGLFLAMPSRKMSNGKFQDMAHPIFTETREEIQATVLEKYNRMLEEGLPDDDGLEE